MLLLRRLLVGLDPSPSCFSMNTSLESNVWGRILHSLQGRLNQQTLETWFRPIQFERLDSSQHVIHLRAPNQIVRDWVVTNYTKEMDESLDEQRLSGYSVGWVIGKVPPFVSESKQFPIDPIPVDVEPVAELAGVGSNSLVAPVEPSLSSK